MPKKVDTKKSLAVEGKTGRAVDSGHFAASTRSFEETVKRMRQVNTASPQVARSKLKELGILSSDGRLSDKYK